MRWTVVIPVKALPAAKSRLLPASSGPDEHRRLVEAIRADTIAAAGAASGVARVLLVANRPGLGALVQTTPGLNGALTDAAAHASSEWPGDGVAALVGDLPALRPEELAAALDAASDDGGFVPDADGTGTTLLTALPGRRLDPRFGAGSAFAHAAAHLVLPAGAGLRRDVDTAAELQLAVELGVGPATAALFRSPSLGMISR